MSKRHLYQLSVEGFLRVRAAFIPFGDKPGVTYITGDNENGKTSILRAIEALLGGKRMLPPDPIHEGMTECRIQGKLGDLIVRLHVKRGADKELVRTLTVEDVDGGVHRDGQTVLNSFLGAFTFDPLDFMRLDEKRKYLALRSLVLGVDWEKMERLHVRDVEKRRDAKREADRLRKVYEAIAVPDDTPRQRVSVERIAKELQAAGTKNTERQKHIAQRDASLAGVTRDTAAIARLKEEMAAQQRRLEELEASRMRNQMDASAIVIPEEVDVSELRRTLTKAEAINAQVDRLKSREDYEGQCRAQEMIVSAVQAEMDARAAEIKRAMEAAKMPVPGLTLADQQVLFNGHPFEQASGMVQLRTSIGVAMAQNPELRVILIRDGGLLGKQAMQVLEEMAEIEDYQVIVERVDDSGKVGIVMVDGLVESTPESRAKGVPPEQIDAQEPSKKARKK